GKPRACQSCLEHAASAIRAVGTEHRWALRLSGDASSHTSLAEWCSPRNSHCTSPSGECVLRSPCHPGNRRCQTRLHQRACRAARCRIACLARCHSTRRRTASETTSYALPDPFSLSHSQTVNRSLVLETSMSLFMSPSP